MKLLQEELDVIEEELSALQGKITLGRAFFWNVVVPLLLAKRDGLTSAEIYDRLLHQGLDVSQSGLRVFLSRYKDRGSLDLLSGGGDTARWRASDSTVKKAIELGYDAKWFRDEEQ